MMNVDRDELPDIAWVTGQIELNLLMAISPTTKFPELAALPLLLLETPVSALSGAMLQIEYESLRMDTQLTGDDLLAWEGEGLPRPKFVVMMNGDFVHPLLSTEIGDDGQIEEIFAREEEAKYWVLLEQFFVEGSECSRIHLVNSRDTDGNRVKEDNTQLLSHEKNAPGGVWPMWFIHA
jgi:sulfur carrier protein ThiS